MTRAITQKQGSIVGRAGNDPATYGLKGRASGRGYLSVLLGAFFGIGRVDNPRVDQPQFFRGFVASDTDPLEPLRRWTTGGRR